MVSNRVLDHTKKLLVGVGGADREPVKKLHHETGEALEGSRNAHRWRHFDQDALGCMDVNLEPAGLVDGRVEKGQ